VPHHCSHLLLPRQKRGWGAAVLRHQADGTPDPTPSPSVGKHVPLFTEQKINEPIYQWEEFLTETFR